MKKIVLLCLVLLCAALLAGCEESETSRQTAAGKNQANEIIKCFNNHDSAALNRMFCKELTVKYGYSEIIESAMKMYSGKCLSHKQLIVNGNYTSDGNVVKDSHINYTITDVKTDGGAVYNITVYSYLTYEENPNRVGITYLKIVNKETGASVEIGKILE